MNKILVPVDFSINSVNALRLACAIAGSHHAAVHLLHVADIDEDISKPDDHKLDHDFAGITKKLREFGKSVATACKINCICSTEYGSVTHMILKKAKQLHADLIIMGKNGNNGPSGLFAGTHACQVAKKSDIPVLIVPGKVARLTCNQVLLPLRPLDSILEKYGRLQPLIVKSKAVITIFSLRNPESDDALDTAHALTELVRNRLELDGLGYNISYSGNDTRFAEEVLKEADAAEKEYDLIVIAPGHQPECKPFQLGLFEQQVIHHSKTPLLLLRGSEALVKDASCMQLIKPGQQS